MIVLKLRENIPMIDIKIRLFFLYRRPASLLNELHKKKTRLKVLQVPSRSRFALPNPPKKVPRRAADSNSEPCRPLSLDPQLQDFLPGWRAVGDHPDRLVLHI